MKTRRIFQYTETENHRKRMLWFSSLLNRIGPLQDYEEELNA